MRRNLILLFMTSLLVGCTSELAPSSPSMTATEQIDDAHPTEEEVVWAVYDPNPKHPWNRVFRQLYRRTTVDGKEYGSAELDPLLWLDTTYLLHGTSHQQAMQVLDEFLTTQAEDLIHDSLKRAMFQRDMWAVFDWLASQTEPYSEQRQALAARLAQVIKRVALTKEEILLLPDNYALAVKSLAFPAQVQADHLEEAFLPSDLFQPDSAWVPMGRVGGPVAMTHTDSFPFFGHSVFLVFVRSPAGRAETLDFIESLNREPNPVTAIGADVALVRRMLLIDDQGDLTLSPLVESIQIRHFNPAQVFHEFELNRARLFGGLAGGLELKSDLFLLFMSHGDVFEDPNIPELKATIPEICKACHFEYPPIPNSGNTRSIISYSRHPFPLPDGGRPILFENTSADEAQTVIEWKLDHQTWRSLDTLWNQAIP